MVFQLCSLHQQQQHHLRLEKQGLFPFTQVCFVPYSPNLVATKIQGLPIHSLPHQKALLSLPSELSPNHTLADLLDPGGHVRSPSCRAHVQGHLSPGRRSMGARQGWEPAGDRLPGFLAFLLTSRVRCPVLKVYQEH